MAEQLFEPVVSTNKNHKGFVVELNWWNMYFVPLGQLSLGANNLLMGDGHFELEKDFCKDKTFFFGIPRKGILIVKAEGATIKVVTEIPEWVGKNCETIQKDMDAYREECRKKSLLYRITHCLAKKDKTAEAIEELESGGGVVFDNVDEFIKDIGIDKKGDK